MTSLKVLKPVTTLDGKKLFPAGAELNEETLLEMIKNIKETDKPLYSLLKHGSVRNDCIEFMSHNPYNEIFAVREQFSFVLDIMEGASVHPAILESLDYFKEYDFDTYRHMLMVSTLSSLLAQILIPDCQNILKEVVSGPTHDLGKICVPLEILKKTSPLTHKERLQLEFHAIAGYVLLSYYLRNYRNMASIVAKDHHERKDCSGYPMGVCQLNRMVEIVVVSDIYDALLMKRPYRPTSFDNRTALEEITEQARQGKIGWEVVQALVAHNRKNKIHFLDCSVSLEKRGSPPVDNLYNVFAPEDTYSENHRD